MEHQHPDRACSWRGGLLCPQVDSLVQQLRQPGSERGPAAPRSLRRQGLTTGASPGQREVGQKLRVEMAGRPRQSSSRALQWLPRTRARAQLQVRAIHGLISPGTSGTARSPQQGCSQLAAFPKQVPGEKAWPARVWQASFLALVLSSRTRSCLPHVLSLSVQQNKTKLSSGLVPPYLEPCSGLQEPGTV